MMDASLIPLLGGAIDFARRALVGDDSHSQPVINTEINVVNTSSTLVYQPIDSTKMELLIGESVQHLASLIDESTTAIVHEIRQLMGVVESIDRGLRERYLRDAIQDVQANVTSLKAFLELPGEERVTEQLVITALHPLQTSIEKARQKLGEYAVPEVWDSCHLVALSTLVAGYEFLGIEKTQMRQGILDDALSIQKRMLDLTALILLQNEGSFPWHQAPHLSSLQGVADLLALFKRAKSYQKPLRIGAQSPAAVAAYVARIHDVRVLQQMKSSIYRRYKVQGVITQRIREIRRLNSRDS